MLCHLSIYIYIYPIGFRKKKSTGLWSVTPGLLQTSVWLQYNHSHEAVDFHMGYIVHFYPGKFDW